MAKDYQDLRYFFEPNGVAVIGSLSDPESGGGAIVRNLLHWYGGSVYPINRHVTEICGHPTYKSVLDVPGPVDLGVLFISARDTLAAVLECAEKGVKAVIIESAGFAEAGPEGQRISDEVMAIAHKAGMRVWGPNCAGFMDTKSGVVTLFGFVESLRRGGASFFGQSGLLSGTLIDAALGSNLFGICKSCSIGNKADLNEADFLEYLGDDPDTRVIAMYLESIIDGQRFLRSARRISREKPLLLLKSGRTQQGSRAAASHTASLAVDDRVAEGALKQAGIIRVDDVMDLLQMTRAFSMRMPASAGKRVAIVTASGAGGVMACDELARRGLVIGTLADDSIARLRDVFPPWTEVGNPIDFWAAVGRVGMDRAFQCSMEVALADKNIDMVFVIMYMMREAAQVDFGALSALTARCPKPVVSWGVGMPHFASVWERGLEAAGIPYFQRIDTAAAVLEAMQRFVARRDETPVELATGRESAIGASSRASDIMTRALTEKRAALDESEAAQVLDDYGVPMASELVAQDEDEAVAAAARLGYPVVLKILSSTITHKSDVGGVKVNLAGETALRAAYRAMYADVTRRLPDFTFEGVLVQEMVHGGTEVIIGLTRHPAFGPVVMFGLGGIFVEALEDVAFRVAPLSEVDAEAMIGEIKAHKVLQGMRGLAPADTAMIKKTLLAVSQLAMDWPQVTQVDVNPLIVFSQGAKAVDAVLALETTAR